MLLHINHDYINQGIPVALGARMALGEVDASDRQSVLPVDGSTVLQEIDARC